MPMIDHDRIASDIRTAAEEVFSTMLSTELRFAESYRDKGPSHPLDGVICLIGMAGEWTGTGTISCSAEFACRIASQMLMAEYAVVDADVLDGVAGMDRERVVLGTGVQTCALPIWTGTGRISCSAKFACRIASQMLMAEYAVVDAEVLDAVAEIANMILGNVKTALERSLGTMGMSIPTAIFGKNFLAKSFGNETWSVVVFDCEGQRLEVKLFLKPAPGAPAPGPAKACAPVYLRA